MVVNIDCRYKPKNQFCWLLLHTLKIFSTFISHFLIVQFAPALTYFSSFDFVFATTQSNFCPTGHYTWPTETVTPKTNSRISGESFDKNAYYSDATLNSYKISVKLWISWTFFVSIKQWVAYVKTRESNGRTLQIKIQRENVKW